MIVRKEIRSLEPAQLRRLREAWERLGDDYQTLAGVHGRPNPAYCPHHRPEFLPWHRLYVADLESRLRDAGYSAGMPYWDWTDRSETVGGLPSAFVDEHYEVDGEERPNPLRSAWIGHLGRSTRRGSLSGAQIRELGRQVRTAMRAPAFWARGGRGFSQRVEAPHDSLHVWVGGAEGDMRRTASAAFDPVFWFHHAHIDRRWAEWQLAHPEVTIPPELRARRLGYYGTTVGETLEHQRLGYTYEGLGESGRRDHDLVPTGSGGFEAFALDAVAEEAALEPRVELLLSGLRMVDESVEIRVALRGACDLAVRRLGSFALLGMGGARVSDGFMGTFDRVLDLGPALAEKGLAADAVEIEMDAVDASGRPVSLEELGIEPRVRVLGG